jgi:hypothetical protein
MKISVENWDSVRASILQVGIKDTEDYPDGALKTIVANDGQRYEFSRTSFEQFKKAGLLKLGIHVRRKKG